MNYHIERLENSHTIYMRNIGPYGSPENFKMMADFKKWIINQNLQNELEEFGILGIALDNPQVTHPKDCRYDVLLCTPEKVHLNNSDVKTGIFKGGKYAVFTVIHTTEAVQQFWSQIGVEIDNNGLVMRNQPIIERFKEEGSDKECEFLVPIQ